MTYLPEPRGAISGLGCASPLRTPRGAVSGLGGFFQDLIDGNTSGSSSSAMLFNSTKYPGICKPSNVGTLAAFKNLQTQINRAAAAKGITTRIAVDGDVGSGTTSLLARVLSLSPTPACTTIASAAPAYAGMCAAIATAAGVAATVPSPAPTTAPTLVLQDGTVQAAPPSGLSTNLLASWQQLSTPMKIAGVGTLAALGFVVAKKLKKGRR